MTYALLFEASGSTALSLQNTVLHLTYQPVTHPKILITKSTNCACTNTIYSSVSSIQLSYLIAVLF